MDADRVAAAIVVGALALTLVGVVTILYSWVVAWAWNALVPMLWHGAPHITWLHGLASLVIIGVIGKLFHK